MGIVASFPGELHQWRLDVTIRSPLALRSAPAGQQAADLAGAAARAGAGAKARRYGPSVVALSWEMFGRLHAESAEALEELARRAASGGGREPLRLARAWRAAAERAMLYAEADGVLLSLGAEAGAHAAAMQAPGLVAGAGDAEEADSAAADRRLGELVEEMLVAAVAGHSGI